MLLFLTTNNSRRDVTCKPAMGQLHDGVILTTATRILLFAVFLFKLGLAGLTNLNKKANTKRILVVVSSSGTRPIASFIQETSVNRNVPLFQPLIVSEKCSEFFFLEVSFPDFKEFSRPNYHLQQTYNS